MQHHGADHLASGILADPTSWESVSRYCSMMLRPFSQSRTSKQLVFQTASIWNIIFMLLSY